MCYNPRTWNQLLQVILWLPHLKCDMCVWALIQIIHIMFLNKLKQSEFTSNKKYLKLSFTNYKKSSLELDGWAGEIVKC